jgi:hypothetical protein
MNLGAILDNPIILSRIIWITTHIIVMIIVAKIIKAPSLCCRKSANIMVLLLPIVAAAFSPFSSRRVLLAVLGYAVEPGAYACGLLLHQIFQIIT